VPSASRRPASMRPQHLCWGKAIGRVARKRGDTSFNEAPASLLGKRAGKLLAPPAPRTPAASMRPQHLCWGKVYAVPRQRRYFPASMRPQHLCWGKGCPTRSRVGSSRSLQ